MNQRYVLVAIIVAALLFGAYQAVELVRSEPSPAPAATPAPVPRVEPRTPPAGTNPYDATSVRSAASVDDPFDVAVARRITARQVAARRAAGTKVRFVDTRVDVDGPIIAGATQVAEADVERWARSVPKNAFVVVYCTCANESTAEREVLALQRLGFRSAYALRDGLLAWESEGLPTESAPRR